MAWAECMLAVIVDERKLTLQDENEFIFPLVPVSKGRVGAGLQSRMVNTKLREAKGPGQASLSTSFEEFALYVVRGDSLALWDIVYRSCLSLRH